MANYFDRQRAKKENPNLTDEQINSFIQQNGLQETPTQQPQQPMMENKPAISNTETFQQNKSFLDKVGDFFLPRASKTARKIAGTVNLKGELDNADKIRADLQKESDKYLEMARKEQDPTKKKKLAELSVSVLDGTTKLYEDSIKQYETSTGQEADAKGINPFIEGFGVAGEVGTYLLPAAKMKEGAGLVRRILTGSATGAASGALLGATTPEELSVGDRAKETLKSAGTGAVAGAVMSSLFELPRSAVKSFLGGNKDRINRLFNISPSDRASFRSSTGDMDFAEEILSRDGKAIAGKSYDQMLEHFVARKAEAQEILEKTLTQSGKKVQKQALVSAVTGLSDELVPEKGFLESTSGGLKATLKSIIDELNGLPDEIDVTVANNIKRQLQEAGDAAFTAGGSKQNTSSSAFAKVAGQVKDAIENVFKDGDTNPIKDMNKSIQLYEQARRSIERVGDRTANKVSNDIAQKFFQIIPTIASAGAGAAGFAAGGGTGALGAFALSQLLLGSAGAMRVKYFTPQVQSKLAQNFTSILKSQGIQQADKVATDIVQRMIKVATVRNADKVNEGESVVSDQTQNNGQIQDNQPTNKPQEENNNQTHTDSIQQPEMITIKNKKTGETKQIKSTEINQYGISGNKNGMPTQDDILTAMAMDLEQTGGKNLGKLSTFLTAMEKVQKANEERGNAGGKAMPAGKATELAEYDSGISVMEEVKGVLENSRQLFDPIKGTMGAMNPYNTSAQMADATLRRASQVVGKALEGGMLRKEDEIKYRKMLPNLTDTPEVAEYKLNNILNMLKTNRQQKVDALIAAGYNPEKADFSTQSPSPQFSDGTSPF